MLYGILGLDLIKLQTQMLYVIWRKCYFLEFLEILYKVQPRNNNSKMVEATEVCNLLMGMI